MTNHIQQTLNERGKQYGSFDSVATVSQRLKGILHSANPSIKLDAVQREAVDMICTKLARICAGVDPNYDDNWRDIAGYAVLGGRLDEKRIQATDIIGTKFEANFFCGRYINEIDLAKIRSCISDNITGYFHNIPENHKGFEYYHIEINFNIKPTKGNTK